MKVEITSTQAGSISFVQPGTFVTWDAVAHFMFAGKAVFTLNNTNTGNRYTYKVKRLKYKDPRVQAAAPYFVYYLTGPDEYKYMATIFDSNRYKLTATNKSRLKPDSLPWAALQWVLDSIKKNHDTGRSKWPTEFQFWHEGQCARCGRALTDPESISRGYGPYCSTVDHVGA